MSQHNSSDGPESFLSDFSARPPHDSHDSDLREVLSTLSLPLVPMRVSRVRLIAIGIPEDVTALINRLHPCGLPASSWSRLQRIPETDEVIRSCRYEQRRSS